MESLLIEKGLSMLLILILLILILLFLLPLLALFFSLDVGKEPRKMDVIIGPEGPTRDRAKTTSYLLKKGYAASNQMIITSFYNKETQMDFRALYFDQLEIPADQIIQENQASSTYTNAVYSLALMKNHQFNSALIVSSDYHIRRVRWCFEKVNQDYGFDLHFTSSYHQNSHGENIPYWKHKEGCRLALKEVIYNIGYWLRLYQWIDL